MKLLFITFGVDSKVILSHFEESVLNHLRFLGGPQEENLQIVRGGNRNTVLFQSTKWIEGAEVLGDNHKMSSY